MSGASFWDPPPPRPPLALVQPPDTQPQGDSPMEQAPAPAAETDTLNYTPAHRVAWHDPIAEACRIAFPIYPPVAPPAAPVLTDAERKQVAGLQARAALAGWQLARMAGGDFVVSRWGALRALPDAAAVEDFLCLVGAPG